MAGRKAESFVLTPIHSGSESTRYRPTAEFAGNLSLGNSIAISGAAVSPNMGYHSSPAITALLTVFNLRLGAWLGNPACKSWQRNEPDFGLLHLLDELCGRTDADNSFIYLSDGGHFENLGIYELVRRRCGFIIASDAGQDGEFHFDDLGGMIRKCRIDLGITITIDIGPVRAGKICWALGTIRYSDVNPGAKNGLLLYIKPVLLSDVPVDVDSYGKANLTFPHQTTLDQFFSESQFESYRVLAQTSVDQLLSGPVQQAAVSGINSESTNYIEQVFRCLPTAHPNADPLNSESSN